MGTVYSMTKLDDTEGLRVVPIKSILSVISVQPHSYQVVPGEQRFFVWEQIGLDMSILLDAEEIPEEED